MSIPLKGGLALVLLLCFLGSLPLACGKKAPPQLPKKSDPSAASQQAIAFGS